MHLAIVFAEQSSRHSRRSSAVESIQPSVRHTVVHIAGHKSVGDEASFSLAR